MFTLEQITVQALPKIRVRFGKKGTDLVFVGLMLRATVLQIVATSVTAPCKYR